MAKASVYLCRKGDALWPTDRASQEKLRKLPEGKMVLCRTHTPRNGKHHRLLWSIAQLIADNSEEWPTAELVVDQLKYGTGHVEERRFMVQGGVWITQMTPASIAYEAMPQNEFSEWFEKAMDFLFTQMMTGLNRPDLEAAVNEYLGVDDWPQQRAA